MDLQIIKNICATHPKAREILRKVNGKRDYKELGKLVGAHHTICSSVLSKAKTFGFLVKEGKYYRKTPEFRHIDVDKLLKDEPSAPTTKKSPKVRKLRKIVETDAIKKNIRDYFVQNFSHITSPFSDKKVVLHKADLEKAAEKLDSFLSQDLHLEQLDGLSSRFCESFISYFSCSRINKAELINAFSNLLKCFEPYVKKVAAIKANDIRFAKMSLNTETISKAISFSSDIDKHQDSYWQDKPVHDACLRFVYPFRHKEAHEARDYTTYAMEKIIFYMFASIIFINLDSYSPRYL
jgi:hypothetical protein